MTTKEKLILSILALLIPIEGIVLGIVFPIFMFGGFGLSIFAMLVVNILVFAYYKDRKDERRKRSE